MNRIVGLFKWGIKINFSSSNNLKNKFSNRFYLKERIINRIEKWRFGNSVLRSGIFRE
jgi:hypothetical protein